MTPRPGSSTRAAWLAAASLAALSSSAGLSSSAWAQAPSADKPAPARPPAKTAPAANEVSGVTVSAASPQGFQSGIDRRSYGLGKDLQATTGSIADALRGVPSVQVDVQGNVSLRGDPNVTIMIDGKPSGMFKGDNRGQMLQQIPASQFERVEVMTNPSAAYSPEGTAGIINLISKQNRGVGLTGSMRGNVGTGDRRNASVSVARNTKALTLSADAGFRRDTARGSIVDQRSRVDTAGAGYAASDQDIGFDAVVKSRNARAGADYDLDRQTRISAELRYTDTAQDAVSSSAFDGHDAQGGQTSLYQRHNQGQIKRSTTGVSGDVRRKFSGADHDFTLHLSREQTRDRQLTHSLVEFQLPAAAPYVEDIRVGDVLDQTRLKAEYRQPMPGGGALTAGYELQVDDNAYDNSGARGPVGGASLGVASLTNRFSYKQTVQGVYATYNQPLGDLTIMPGLRLEQTDIDTHQITSGLKDSNDYLRAYPSFHVQYRLDEARQLNASYSRRIQRPVAQDLNPYPVYVDPYTYKQGNPRLRPQVTDSFEAAYQQRRGFNYYLATLYWREARDGVTDVVQDLGGGVLLTTRENLAKSRSGGLELVANARLTPKLSYTISGNGYWNEIAASDLGFPDKRSAWVVSGYAALNLQATPKDLVQVSGFAIGKRLTPQGYREPTGMLNIGYRHKFNDRLSGVVTVQDALNSFGDRLVVDTAALRERRVQDLNLRGVYIGLTWGFGGQAPQTGRRPRDPAFDFQGGATNVGL
jgi:outer membrane receptor protein involved in Fe transport